MPSASDVNRYPWVVPIERLAAARWLAAAGDTARASRLLTWYEANVTAAHSVGISMAMGPLTALERARLEEGQGRKAEAIRVYRHVTERMTQPDARLAPFRQEAVTALQRLERKPD